jgi:hypothetical protein
MRSIFHNTPIISLSSHNSQLSLRTNSHASDSGTVWWEGGKYWAPNPNYWKPFRIGHVHTLFCLEWLILWPLTNIHLSSWDTRIHPKLKFSMHSHLLNVYTFTYYEPYELQIGPLSHPYMPNSGSAPPHSGGTSLQGCAANGTWTGSWVCAACGSILPFPRICVLSRNLLESTVSPTKNTKSWYCFSLTDESLPVASTWYYRNKCKLYLLL